GGAPVQRAGGTGRAPPPAANGKSVAAPVNGDPILEGAVQRGLRRVPSDRQAEVRGVILNYLIDNVLIEQHLKQAGFKVEQTEVGKKVEEMKTEIKKEKLDYATVLKEMELTEGELREHIMADLRWEKYATTQATDKALQDLFNRQKDMFDGSQVRVRHILLTPDSRDAK